MRKNGELANQMLRILIGSTIVAFTTKYIYDQAGLVTGGVSGLAIVVRHVSQQYLPFEIPLGLSSIILNLPIFAYAIRIYGIRGIRRTIIAWSIVTTELFIFPDAKLIPDQMLLVAVYGGIGFGVGTGLLLSAQSTSGGTDLLGNTLHRFFRQYSQGRIIQVLDGIVVAIGAFVFRLENTLYAVIAIYFCGRVTDAILNHGRGAKMAFVISTKGQEIADAILKEMHRGVTGLQGQGMYTGEKKSVLLCIGSSRDMVALKDVVKKYDERAFLVVSNVGEAMGEGFVENWMRE